MNMNFEQYLQSVQHYPPHVPERLLLTWEKTTEELETILTVAEALKYLRDHNISARLFDSGLAISQFRDNSTRTRFSFASAANLLGLAVQDLDEGKSQIAMAKPSAKPRP
jgi:ornithine carbamoyltransferase